MGFELFEERLKCDADGSDLIGQGREADGNAFTGQLLGLAVEGLMIAELLNDDTGKEIRSRPSPGRRVEWRRRLADRFAIAACELLTHGLQDEEAARDLLKAVGRRLAQLGKSLSAAALAGGRRRNHHPLARQMLRKGLAGGPLAREGANRRGLRRRHLRFDVVLGGCGFLLGELQLKLIQKPCSTLRPDPKPLPLELCNLELEMSDGCIGGGSVGLGGGQLRLSLISAQLRFDEGCSERLDIARLGCARSIHEPSESWIFALVAPPSAVSTNFF